MRTLFIAFLILSTALATAQSSDVDSLKNSVADLPDSMQSLKLSAAAFKMWAKNPEKTEELGRAAYEKARTINFSKGLADASRVMGISFWARGNNTEATKYFLESLTHAQEIGYELGIANAFGNLGLAYEEQRLLEESHRNHFEALRLFKKLNNQERIATTLNNIGSVHHKIGNLDSALYYINEAALVRAQINDRYGYSESMNNLGVLLRNNSRFEEAEVNFKKSLEVREQLDDRNGLAAVKMNLGVNQLLQKKYATAIDWLLKAKKDAEAIKSDKWLLQIYHFLKKAEQERGNLRAALEYGEFQMTLESNLFKLEKADELARLQAKYENEKKAKMIAVLEAKQARERLYKNIILIVLVQVIFAATYFIIQQRRRSQEKEQHLKLRAENAELRQQDLQKEIEFKNKELASYTINFIQKSQLLEQISEGLKTARQSTGDKTPQLVQLTKLVDNSQQIDNDWNDFKLRFEQVHPNFFKTLKEKMPDLSTSDLKLCALIRLNFNIKESARILGIAPDSVKMSRYRLRKKLNLESEEGLNAFVLSIAA